MIIKKKVFALIFSLILLSSCKENKQTQEVSFYHWKSKAKNSQVYQKALKKAKSKKIYLHYFDIIKSQSVNKQQKNEGIHPEYVLKEVDTLYRSYSIIPVIYITNNVFKEKNLDITLLAKSTSKLIAQISNTHFKNKPTEVQVDCDWTQTTKNNYFEFLKTLSKTYSLSATIRLHQVKFQNRTGIPPVKKGTLMLYNMGDLRNKDENSILENAIVKQYINTKTQYPIPLNIALPLFSQTIITSPAKKVKIIKNTQRNVLENDSHFKKINETSFTVIKDTLYKGFFLVKDFHLKLEKPSEKKIINAYKTVLNSRLVTNGIIFYHLDEQSLNSINLNTILKSL